MKDAELKYELQISVVYLLYYLIIVLVRLGVNRKLQSG